MSAWAIGLITLICVFSGALFGVFLQHKLPEHHLNERSKDVVRLVATLLATLSALVLGLLIASAKDTFNDVHQRLRANAARLIVIDRVLAQYGPETKGARQGLKAAYGQRLDRLFREGRDKDSSVDALQDARLFEDFERGLRALTPGNDAQRALLSRAQQLADDVIETRWAIFEDVNAIPAIFLAVLISWLVMVFASFGVFAARNVTTLFAMLFGAFAVATSIFLIEDLNRPFDGWIVISSGPMRNALAILGQ